MKNAAVILLSVVLTVLSAPTPGYYDYAPYGPSHNAGRYYLVPQQYDDVHHYYGNPDVASYQASRRSPVGVPPMGEEFSDEESLMQLDALKEIYDKASADTSEERLVLPSILVSRGFVSLSTSNFLSLLNSLPKISLGLTTKPVVVPTISIG